VNLMPEAWKDRRIEELEQSLAIEQQARFAAEQDARHWRERCEELLALCLDCWTQFAYERKGGGYHDGGLSTLERLYDELLGTGLVDEKGSAVKR
jgi:hypothetical protein